MQVIYGEANTVRVVANAPRQAGVLVQEGNWYGVPVESASEGEEYALYIRGVFEVEKADTSQSLASGEKVEFSSQGKVARLNTGAAIGKVYEPSPTGNPKVKIILMPELY